MKLDTSHKLTDQLYLITDRFDQFVKYGVINQNYEVIVPCLYDEIKLNEGTNLIEAISDGYNMLYEIDYSCWSWLYYWCAKYNRIFYNFEGKQIIITNDNKQLILHGKSDRDFYRERYDAIYDYPRVHGDELLDYDTGHGLWPVMKDERWGFVDDTGKEVIPCRFYHIGKFHEGRCSVELDGHSAIIDTLGNIIQISSNFNHISDFSNGIAKVRYWHESFIDSYHFHESEEREININGQLIVRIDNEVKLLNPKYTWYQITEDNLIEVYSEGKYGLLDRDLKQILPCTHDTIRFLKNK